jgi:hypothetical protein
MDKVEGQLLTHARALRALCGDLAHGAAREAFCARVDAEIDALQHGLLRAVVVGGWPADGGAATPRPALERLAADDALRAAGIAEMRVVTDPGRVLLSPLLWGDVVHNCDVVVLTAPITAEVRGALATLAQQARCAVVPAPHAGARDASCAEADDAATPGGTEAPLPFREVRAIVPAANPTANFTANAAAALGAALPPEVRAQALAEGTIGRLLRCAELLQRHLHAEVAAQKFRAAEVARLRRGEDAQEAGGDMREQTERLKATLDAWTRGCQADLARMAEHGVLPFDPRLLANKVTVHDLLHREEKSPAVTRYPILGHGAFQSLVSHTYVVLPDPAAVEQIRQQLVTALSTQTARDAEVLNHRAQDLAARLRAGVALYPQLKPALDALRLPALAPAALAAPVNAIALEVEVEDKLTRVGFFKRMMEGRMVASMAFSFLTMSAGVFVLFGEPNIKRGLMKFSGVIVIMMVLYFIFSMLVRREEEKQELEEVLERLRARLNQEVMRPLAKVQQAILKAYGEYVEDVAAAVQGAVEAVVRGRTAERARVTEQRKAEDELQKAFLARRQQAATNAAQKLGALATALERLRVELGRPETPGLAARPPLASLAPTAAPRPAAGAAAPAGTTAAATERAGAAPAPSLEERVAAARAAMTQRLATATSKPMSASERLAAARARAAEAAPAAAPRSAAAAPASPAAAPQSSAGAAVPSGAAPAATATAPVPPALAPELASGDKPGAATPRTDARAAD